LTDEIACENFALGLSIVKKKRPFVDLLKFQNVLREPMISWLKSCNTTSFFD